MASLRYELSGVDKKGQNIYGVWSDGILIGAISYTKDKWISWTAEDSVLHCFAKNKLWAEAYRAFHRAV